MSRFASYVQELREILSSHGVKTGSTEDVFPVVTRLATPGTASDDMTSILRSIIYREHEAMPRPELVNLLLVAVAGSPIHQPSVPLQQAIFQLEAYVAEVIASRRGATFTDDPPSPHDLVDSEHNLVPEGADFPSSELPQPQALAAPSAPAPTAAPEPRRERPFADLKPASGVAPLSRPQSQPAHLASRPNDGSAPTDAPAGLQTSPHLPVNPASSLLPVGQIKALTPRRSAFAAGIAALLLVAAASIFLRHKSPVPVAPSSSPAPLVASTSTFHPEPPSDAFPATGSPSPSSPTLRQPDPSSAGSLPANRVGPAAIQPVPPPPSAQPQSPVPPTTPAQPIARTPGRPRPNAARQAAPQALINSGKQPSGKSASFLVSSGVMDGNLITVPTTPTYPKMANMAGIEGKVILQAVISRNGNVVATHVLDGHRLLRGAAAHAVRGWRYRPYLVHGKPTDIATIVIVDFHLPH